MTDAPVRVLIVDDHPLFRRGVRQLLDMDDQLAVAGEAADGETALALAETEGPDMILLDVGMSTMDGLETLRRLRAVDRETRVVMLTVSDSDEDVIAALRAGADGYLLKDMEPEALLSRLREAATGEMVVSERLGRTLAAALGGREDDTAAQLAQLTGREHGILMGMARGLSNKQIANEAGISDGTVKVHVKSVLRKLGFNSRVQAAIWAVNRGLAKERRRG
jgi:two-component system nitrate/nitrite response regulator NarL